MLDLARVLGRGMDQHIVVLAGDRVGDLTLEIKMILSTCAYGPGNTIRRFAQRRIDVAKAHGLRGQKIGIGRERVVDRDKGGKILLLHAPEFYIPAFSFYRLSH